MLCDGFISANVDLPLWLVLDTWLRRRRDRVRYLIRSTSCAGTATVPTDLSSSPPKERDICGKLAKAGTNEAPAPHRTRLIRSLPLSTRFQAKLLPRPKVLLDYVSRGTPGPLFKTRHGGRKREQTTGGEGVAPTEQTKDCQPLPKNKNNTTEPSLLHRQYIRET